MPASCAVPSASRGSRSSAASLDVMRPCSCTKPPNQLLGAAARLLALVVIKSALVSLSVQLTPPSVIDERSHGQNDHIWPPRVREKVQRAEATGIGVYKLAMNERLRYITSCRRPLSERPARYTRVGITDASDALHRVLAAESESITMNVVA